MRKKNKKSAYTKLQYRIETLSLGKTQLTRELKVCVIAFSNKMQKYIPWLDDLT